MQFINDKAVSYFLSLRLRFYFLKPMGSRAVSIEITNTSDIKHLVNRREQVEASFARNVYNVFNRPPALSTLHQVTAKLMKLMANGPAEALNRALHEESNLRLFKSGKVPHDKTGIAMFESEILVRRGGLDASDCADVIRLAGAWVEQGGFGDATSINLPNSNSPGTVKNAFRPGGNAVWGKEARDRGKGWEIEDHLKSFMRDPQAKFSGMGGLHGLKGKVSKRATRNSNTLKLDRLFGLTVGCDISGTTSDSTFALELFGHELGLSAGYYMLPMGTIVHNMHHTLLEVALPICLNGEMDYHVGFFSTLRPTAAHNFTPELTGLEEAMQMADSEMHSEKLHIICYWNDSTPQSGMLYPSGLFQLDHTEVERLLHSPLSRAVHMLEEAPHLHSFPDRNAVLSLLSHHGIIV